MTGYSTFVGANARPPQDPLPTRLLHEQHRKLRDAAGDQFPVLVLALNVGLGLAVLALALIGILNEGNQETVLIVLTILAAEIGVLLVSSLDRLRVRSKLTRSLEETVLGRRLSRSS